MLRFDLIDTGRGLSKAERERMFDPPVAANGVEARSGAKLSMAIARKLAELMGGEVGCDSKLGTGTLSWFLLPFERVREDAPTPRQSEEPLLQTPLLGPRTRGRGQRHEPHVDRRLSR
jgi:K+-sensing histidine kinase KdpD